MSCDGYNIIIDFDSTFVQTETLDELAVICNVDTAQKKAISDITHCTMSGSMSFQQALQERVHILSPSKQQMAKACEILGNKITPSFQKNKAFISQHAESIYIFSGGFTEIIVPIVAEFGIKAHHIFANDLIYNSRQQAIGVNDTLLLAQDLGKAQQLTELKLTQPVYAIGDGYTDYEMKSTGMVTSFYLFAENVLREKLKDLADSIIYSFDDFIKDRQS